MLACLLTDTFPHYTAFGWFIGLINFPPCEFILFYVFPHDVVGRPDGHFSFCHQLTMCGYAYTACIGYNITYTVCHIYTFISSCGLSPYSCAAIFAAGAYVFLYFRHIHNLILHHTNTPNVRTVTIGTRGKKEAKHNKTRMKYVQQFSDFGRTWWYQSGHTVRRENRK